MINYEQLTNTQRTTRQNIRNAFLIATPDEARSEIEWHRQRDNWFAIACILEIMGEE